MFGLAYVLVPREFSSLQARLDLSLEPYRRVTQDQAPERFKLQDETANLLRLHASRLRHKSGRSIVSEDLIASFFLRYSVLHEHLKACRLDRFEGTLAEIEPDLDAFARRFTNVDHDPATNRYGRWVNPLGYWDWWDLGGRFNGVIVGDRGLAQGQSLISSGESAGRVVMETVDRMLGASRKDMKAAIEANVELAETLLPQHRSGKHKLPMAVVLPVGSCEDAHRWFDCDELHGISPGTRAFFNDPEDADFRDLLIAALKKFSDHAVAGVSYHY